MLLGALSSILRVLHKVLRDILEQFMVSYARTSAVSYATLFAVLGAANIDNRSVSYYCVLAWQ